MVTRKDSLWKESFTVENFNVDQCLSKYTQKSDLETLRKDLQHYGSELQTQMSDILKMETESIVNLAEYLTNLSSKINDLSIPICQLSEEIRTLKDLVGNAKGDYKKVLDQIKSNNVESNNIILKLDLTLTSFYIEQVIRDMQEQNVTDLLALDRIINMYSFQRCYMEELGIMTKETEETTKNVEVKLIKLLNNSFLTSISDKNDTIIKQCLRMYVNLDRQNEAHRTYQISVVRPALAPFFSEKNLENINHNIKDLYDSVLQFINTETTILSNIISQNPDLRSFNFILNSFWSEFDKLSRESLPYITAPGNPELFQTRFKATCNLLKQIAMKSGDEDLLQSNVSFQDHLKRFNLPVYFEIRFQQIAGAFEAQICLPRSQSIFAQNNSINSKFKVTLGLWEAIQRTFCEEVFIVQLTDQFIKLFLLLVSRYVTYFESTIKDNNFLPSELEDYIISALHDFKIVNNLIKKEIEDSSNSIFAQIPEKISKILLPKLLSNNQKSLSITRKNLENCLIQLKVNASKSHLDNVESIPRLYRRTNRASPEEASSYVVEAVKPVHQLSKKLQGDPEEAESILSEIIGLVTKYYGNLVQKVLNSVCKTEESLRRLKSRSMAASEDASGQSYAISDEIKIREQIRFDVEFFVNSLSKLGVQRVKEELIGLKNQIKS